MPAATQTLLDDGVADVDQWLADEVRDVFAAQETAAFMMNRRTLSEVRKFKDADGNYIWQPSTEAGQPSTLLGYQLNEVEDMPDISSESAVMAFGDFRRGYLIIDRQGVRVLRDPYSAKPYVLFYTTKRVGGGVQDFNAIKLLKTSAG